MCEYGCTPYPNPPHYEEGEDPIVIANRCYKECIAEGSSDDFCQQNCVPPIH